MFDLFKLAEPFPAKDIDWRIQRCGKNNNGVWAMVIAYIDARSVMERLDDVVGPGNWKDRYWREDKGVMCGLSIRIDGEWVEKVDGSDETDIEAFKGGISKSLVRAAVKWGIGRYLYNLGDAKPKISQTQFPGGRYAKDRDAGIFYWAPPELPAWALPAAKPANASSNEGSSVAAKSKATQDQIKGRLANGQTTVSQAGASKASGQGEQKASSGGSEKTASPKGDGTNKEGPRTQRGPAHSSATGLRSDHHSGVTPHQIEPSNPKGMGEENDSDPDKNELHLSGPRAGNASPANGGDDSGEIDFGTTEPPQLRGESKNREALQPLPERGPGNGSGHAEGARGGASEKRSKNPKPVPGTLEEIEWFYGHIKETLREVKTKPQLAQVWTSNAASIAALPEQKRNDVIALKDEIKARFL